MSYRFKPDALLPEGFTHRTYWDGALYVIEKLGNGWLRVTNERGHRPITVHEDELIKLQIK